MQKTQSEVKAINLGIEFLRLSLCFWVVIWHCSFIKNEHSKYLQDFKDYLFHIFYGQQ